MRACCASARKAKRTQPHPLALQPRAPFTPRTPHPHHPHHARAVPSHAPLNARVPSSLIATERTAWVWPVSVNLNRQLPPGDTSHTRSQVPVGATTTPPSADSATDGGGGAAPPPLADGCSSSATMLPEPPAETVSGGVGYYREGPKETMVNPMRRDWNEMARHEGLWRGLWQHISFHTFPKLRAHVYPHAAAPAASKSSSNMLNHQDHSSASNPAQRHQGASLYPELPHFHDFSPSPLSSFSYPTPSNHLQQYPLTLPAHPTRRLECGSPIQHSPSAEPSMFHTLREPSDAAAARRAPPGATAIAVTVPNTAPVCTCVQGCQGGGHACEAQKIRKRAPTPCQQSVWDRAQAPCQQSVWDRAQAPCQQS
eukprot:359531-Chlamydomonas_euryale.AAC.6